MGAVRLPADLKPRDVVRALERAGWTPARQTGGHVIVVHPGRRPISVPMHNTIKRGLLRGIIREARLSVVQFTELL